MSFPRYLLMAKSAAAGNSSLKQLIRSAILKEVFLAGSLMKSEVAETLARQATRNAQILSKVKSMQALTELTNEACDELTLEHVLIGVTSTNDQGDTAAGLQKNTKEESKIGAKKKRETKKAQKDQEKIAAQLDDAPAI